MTDEWPTPSPFETALAGKTVLVTGHTGFTGGWACLWLHALGARVVGFSLSVPTNPSLFEQANLAALVEDRRGDLRDYAAVANALRDAKPELVLHLAAQPLVRRSRREPLATFAANVMGTAHVLEAARNTPGVRGVLCVTTDKVYRNDGQRRSFREDDPLGGDDPYSASKAAAEMVIGAYRASWPLAEGKGPALAAARGGNIIGGGDWAEDRLVPDFVRAVVAGTPLTLRHPNATRPWQHVLGLVEGYLRLLAGLASATPEPYARAWNLGPDETRAYPARDLLEMLAAPWRRPALNYEDRPAPECQTLALDSALARERLGWRPPWDTQTAAKKTAEWYRCFYEAKENARELTLRQLREWRAAGLDNAGGRS